MLNLLLVGSGGFLGSALRYMISQGMQSLAGSAVLPYGTLAVNLLGCLTIGLLGGIAHYREVFSPEIRLFVFTGMLGGFTTFSTFGYETFNLGRSVGFNTLKYACIYCAFFVDYFMYNPILLPVIIH